MADHDDGSKLETAVDAILAKRPSYNVAVTECQIADDSLSHFSHIPSNLTPATRV